MISQKGEEKGVYVLSGEVGKIPKKVLISSEECVCPKCGCTEVDPQLHTDEYGSDYDPICKKCGYRLGDDWYADYAEDIELRVEKTEP